MPSGFNILPSIPDKKKIGVKATMVINVALMIEVRISHEPL